MTQDEVLTSIKEHVSYAKQFLKSYNSPEDATRTEIPFLIECVQTAINAGATIINILIQLDLVILLSMVKFLSN